MNGPWRLAALAAAFCVTVGVGVAQAQTVIVRNAPAGSNVELVLNGTSIGTATSGPAGTATLAVKRASDAETDVQFYVDSCGTARRVLLDERGLVPPAPAAGCERRNIAGFFVMRRVTTFVVDLAGAAPMVWVAQGAAPSEWLGEKAAGAPVRKVPTGFIVFGGGGLARYADAEAIACGDVAPCSGSSSKVSLSAGVGYWFLPFLGAEATYLRPATLTVNGNGGTYTFTDIVESNVFTAAIVGGVPAGPVRLYGKAGVNYNRTTATTTETTNDTTIIVGGAQQTIAGGTQSLVMQTSGIGWVFGGGLEGWVRQGIAIYGEAGYLRLKGKSTNGGEGSTDDRVTYALVGIRLRLGG